MGAAATSQFGTEATSPRHRPRDDPIQTFSKYFCPVLAYSAGMSAVSPTTAATWAADLLRIGGYLVEEFAVLCRIQAALEVGALQLVNDYFAAPLEQAVMDRVMDTATAQRLFERVRTLYQEDGIQQQEDEAV